MSSQPHACLQIFVTENCLGCEMARELASELLEEFAALRIDFVDMNDPQRPHRPDVFATPTYVLNDKIISLGNPNPTKIREQIRAVLATPTHGLSQQSS